MTDKDGQISLFEAPKDASPIARIMAAARLHKIVRSSWGIHLRGGRCKLDGDGCCPIGAFLDGVPSQPHEMSPRATAARMLGISSRDVDAFIRGFDGHMSGENVTWELAGLRAATQLGLT